YKFIAERSADDSVYTAIGEVAAQGNSVDTKEYGFTDQQLLNGMNYFRIKTLRINGKAVNSAVRIVNNTSNDLRMVDSFRVIMTDGSSLLQWKTLQELNTVKFVIERSADGNVYSAIGEVSA